jgi:hypothetical protein
VPGISPYLPKSERKNRRYLDPAAFTPPPAGTFGNVGRNGLVGPGYAGLDLALSRGFALGATRIELRAEAFNLLNGRNDTLVGRILSVGSNFGQLIS